MNTEIWNQRCIIAPSLISCCDLCNLERSVCALERAGAEVLHVDILDGHFSPSMPLGLDTVRQLRDRTDMAFDVHVMTSAHDFFIGELLDIGVQQITFHAEQEPHIDMRIRQIQARGVRAGVALKPATPLSVLDYVLESCDTVLLMLINPGYAQEKSEGQVSYAGKKVRQLREHIARQGLGTRILLDGRISREDILEYGASGLADEFVAGSTCLSRSDLENSTRQLLAFRQDVLKEG